MCSTGAQGESVKQLTLTIIKPDAMGRGLAGKIIAHLEAVGFELRAARMLRLNAQTAGGFYAEHLGKPFFEPLVEFMTSGAVLVAALEREDAVAELRRVIGATDPAQAEPGTVRKLYAESKSRNAIHASDSPQSAARELAYYFSSAELIDNSR
jgi:nucleoside-diphosphate kinase